MEENYIYPIFNICIRYCNIVFKDRIIYLEVVSFLVTRRIEKAVHI